jgi:hypothetical protein
LTENGDLVKSGPRANQRRPVRPDDHVAAIVPMRDRLAEQLFQHIVGEGVETSQ